MKLTLQSVARRATMLTSAAFQKVDSYVSSPLAEFQTTCEGALTEVLEFHGRDLVGKSVCENGEPFIHGWISGSDVQVWVCPDEVECRLDKGSRNYAAAVCGDERRTIESFVADMARELESR